VRQALPLPCAALAALSANEGPPPEQTHAITPIGDEPCKISARIGEGAVTTYTIAPIPKGPCQPDRVLLFMPIARPRPSHLAPTLLLAGLSLPALFAQAPAFDVASIKRSQSLEGASTERATRGRFIARNVTIAELIQFAFGVRDFQVSGGPGWLRVDRFDIVATTGTSIDLNDKLLEPYLQSLLLARARFRYHKETREMQAYSLAVAKNGPRMTVSAHKEEDSTHEISHEPGKTVVTASNAGMADLVAILNRELRRTVIDNTSIDGQFDLRLEWSPDSSPDSAAPSLFTALQEQLGLKLASANGPVEIIVIDNIERPSEN
jgi:uncharacterized protein (TIGR03435 family)